MFRVELPPGIIVADGMAAGRWHDLNSDGALGQTFDLWGDSPIVVLSGGGQSLDTFRTFFAPFLFDYNAGGAVLGMELYILESMLCLFLRPAEAMVSTDNILRFGHVAVDPALLRLKAQTKHNCFFYHV